MVTSEILKRECDEIAARTGFYVPPPHMSTLMKTAQKITEIIMSNAVCMSYHESLLVLRIVMNVIKEVTGEIE